MEITGNAPFLYLLFESMYIEGISEAVEATGHLQETRFTLTNTLNQP